MAKSGKGSAFEREVCKALSLWWTQGLETPRDDIFWRSAQSGGRATQRRKQGQTTANSEGDIGLLDPIGQPFLDAVCLELKRGYGEWSLQDIVDMPERNKPKVLDFWSQAASSNQQKQATGSSSVPALLLRKDKRRSLLVFQSNIVETLRKRNGVPFEGDLLIVDAPTREIQFFAFDFEHFLSWCAPEVFLRPLL